MSATQKLELYIRYSCPFCKKVLRFMDKEHIELKLHDISASDADRVYLVEHGGKQQVPCLFIDGAALYESDDIISWLAANAR